MVIPQGLQQAAKEAIQSRTVRPQRLVESFESCSLSLPHRLDTISFVAPLLVERRSEAGVGA
jgi:hypothetical protein